MDLIPNNAMAEDKKLAVEKYFNMETELMATEGYSECKQAILRRKAVRVILENSRSREYDWHKKFDLYIAYLAMNYFDRFISRHQLPVVKGQVRNDTVLLALSCLTIAWRTKIRTFVLDDFTNERNLREFSKSDIWKMEYHALKGLEGRTRPLTAFSFVEYLAEKLPLKQGFRRSKINEIIVQTQGDITYTQFKPSIIAASAILTICTFLYPDQYDTCKEILLSSGYFKEEDLGSCVDKTIAMCKEKEITMDCADEQLKFELKWIADENEDVTIDSPFFRSNVPPDFYPNNDQSGLAVDPNDDSEWLLCSEELF